MGGNEARQASLGRLCAAEGWRIYQQREFRPLTNVSLWAEASLVVLVSPHEAHTLPLLEMLRQVEYEGPFVVLAWQPSTDVRQLAFRQGARDVIGLPTTAQHIKARLQAVLHIRTYVSNRCVTSH